VLWGIHKLHNSFLKTPRRRELNHILVTLNHILSSKLYLLVIFRELFGRSFRFLVVTTLGFIMIHNQDTRSQFYAKFYVLFRL
jgi:hypothetical protein